MFCHLTLQTYQKRRRIHTEKFFQAHYIVTFLILTIIAHPIQDSLSGCMLCFYIFYKLKAQNLEIIINIAFPSVHVCYISIFNFVMTITFQGCIVGICSTVRLTFC